jgi:hypothetical protein
MAAILVLLALGLLGMTIANARVARATANDSFLLLIALPLCWLVLIAWLFLVPYGSWIWIVHVVAAASLLPTVILLARHRGGLAFYAPYAAFNLLLIGGLWVLAQAVVAAEL